MIRRDLYVGRWCVEFYFAPGGYDTDLLFDRLYDLGAPMDVLRQSLALTESGNDNTGFTFTNPYERVALIAIGPTTSGDEFIDTLTHELHHLSVAITDSLGIDLDSETPAYITGDAARELAETICELGCNRCN